MPRDGILKMGMPAKLGRCVTTWNEVTEFPKGLCSREGKVGDIFVLVISIAIWNQIHTERISGAGL